LLKSIDERLLLLRIDEWKILFFIRGTVAAADLASGVGSAAGAAT
jgi:hypothetical protein